MSTENYEDEVERFKQRWAQADAMILLCICFSLAIFTVIFTVGDAHADPLPVETATIIPDVNGQIEVVNWSYDDPPATWPQTKFSESDYPAISGVAIKVTFPECGQVDFYNNSELPAHLTAPSHGSIEHFAPAPEGWSQSSKQFPDNCVTSSPTPTPTPSTPPSPTPSGQPSSPPISTPVPVVGNVPAGVSHAPSPAPSIPVAQPALAETGAVNGPFDWLLVGIAVTLIIGGISLYRTRKVK